ncbi:MAG: hypothetical protein HN919_01725 [Verrucomicrobia bacterium]|jgi:hypothetical protein|nr:hypothetical protein [Verrucomicrobiota bacterium]MBT7064997.1 hypothetical protein [Verrucomicrobiota bacterium]MBT7700477.1 hypothetical protein [Verrucomicrobiota bacterium]
MTGTKRIWCAVLVLSCVAGGLLQAEEDDGYFLPMKQKGQLIWRGRVEGDDGTWYDIRIVPGYTHPARYSWRNLKQAGDNLGEYVGKKKYADMWDTTTDCFEWAYDDCLADFTVKGSGRAWKKYFRQAKRRSDKRVFGWWLSYPWAVMQSTVDNVVRIPVGLIGTAAGTVWGGAVVPVYHVANSGVKAVWNGGVEGVALPVVGAAWNTVAAPPLSLLGQRPSQARVDGFWVCTVDGAAPIPEPDNAAVTAVSDFGVLLRNELKSLEEQRREVERKRDADLVEVNKQRQKIYNQSQAEMNRILDQERVAVGALCADAAHASLVQSVRAAGWDRARIHRHHSAILQAMMTNGLSREAANRAMSLLVANAPYPATVRPSAPPKKTDPVRASIEVIKDID